MIRIYIDWSPVHNLVDMLIILLIRRVSYIAYCRFVKSQNDTPNTYEDFRIYLHYLGKKFETTPVAPTRKQIISAYIWSKFKALGGLRKTHII